MTESKISLFKSWVVCLCASLFFSYELIQLHMLNAISPMLMSDLHLTATHFGQLCSSYLLADVIFLLPAGMILDRFSTKKVILSALGFCILGTFGFSLSQNLWQAFFSHFLSGIGNAFCFLSCMILIARWFPKEYQSRVISLVITIGMIGAMIAQTPFSHLAAIFQWRTTLMIDGWVGVAIFGLIYLFVEDAPSFAQVANKASSLTFVQSVRAALKNPLNVLCGLYTGFMNLPLMILSAVWGSLFLHQIHHIDLTKASFLVSLISMGTLFGSPLAGFLSERFGKFRVMTLGALFSLALIFALLLSGPNFFFLASIFFLLGLVTSSQVLGYPIITENNPEEITGTAMGIAAVIIMGMPAFIQPLTGWMMDLSWAGSFIGSMRLYSYASFAFAFSIFPIGFILSLWIQRRIRLSFKQSEKQVS